MLDTNVKPKWVQRHKWNELDGTAHEKARIRDGYNLGVDELEALGHEALHVAAEWRQEIAERVPTPPTHQVFTFSCGYSDRKIATWVELPWALVRIGKGTSVVFLVKGKPSPARIRLGRCRPKRVVNGALRWKRRFETPTTVNQRDLIHVFHARCRTARHPATSSMREQRHTWSSVKSTGIARCENPHDTRGAPRNSGSLYRQRR